MSVDQSGRGSDMIISSLIRVRLDGVKVFVL